MNSLINVSRRDFFKLSVAGAGLVIGFTHVGCSEKDPSSRRSDSLGPSDFLEITPDNKVTIRVIESEMGQGVWTSLPMLIAEELDVDWSVVLVEQSPMLPGFRHNITWGSSSIRKNWTPLRQAGAIARDMLLRAAAERWQVPVNECVVRSGFVFHDLTNQRENYGALAVAASRLPIPDQVALKTPDKFKCIGFTKPLLDAPSKINGSAVFGIDVKIDGLLIATVAHSPVFGGKLKNIDAKDALNIPGVRHILQIDSGVAVVADHFWAAEKGYYALKLQWDAGPNEGLDSESIRNIHENAILGDAEILQQLGDERQAQYGEARTLEATYEAAYQAHAAMEPICCTVDVREDSCEIWAPTQAPGRAQWTAARYLLSKPEQLIEKFKEKLVGNSLEMVKVHTTFLGGAFGRRAEQDFVAEAVQISQAVAKPVKLIWKREEDIQHDYYRPYTYHKIKAGLDDRNNLIRWTHRIAGPSGHISTDGANLPYSSESYSLEYVETEAPVPVGYWRSVGSSHNVYVIESFIDELAAAAGEDPYLFRRRHLTHNPRLNTVLELAAGKAGWGSPLPEGRFRGLAVNNSHGSYVAQVAEISIGSQVKVHRVTCAVDCGQVINPDTVRAQMEGSIVFGLTASIKGAITISGGRVVQSNFHDFPILRINEMPEIDTYIVDSNEFPGGIGEPGVPPVAPALANALYAATGNRIRVLPIPSE